MHKHLSGHYNNLLPHLSPVTPDPPGQPDVPGHDGHPPSMYGAQLSVLEQGHQVGLGCLLQGHDGSCLEPEVDHGAAQHSVRHLSDDTGERKAWYEEVTTFLIVSNFLQSQGARTVSSPGLSWWGFGGSSGIRLSLLSFLSPCLVDALAAVGEFLPGEGLDGMKLCLLAGGAVDLRAVGCCLGILVGGGLVEGFFFLGDCLELTILGPGGGLGIETLNWE